MGLGRIAIALTAAFETRDREYHFPIVVRQCVSYPQPMSRITADREKAMLSRDAMIEIAENSMHYQDIGEVEKQLAPYAEDCTFLMPVNAVPMSGLDGLRKSVEGVVRSAGHASLSAGSSPARYRG